MACETLILRKYFTHHGKIRLIYSVAGHAYGPAHEARLVQLTVGAAKEQTAREYRYLTRFSVGLAMQVEMCGACCQA